MTLCIGEILVDLIGEYQLDALKYQPFAGGAPFNVACGIKMFGGQVTFIGNVGDDLMGKFLIDFASKQDLNQHITIDKEHDTTLAFVKNDKNGERNFCFYRKNTADYYINEDAIKEVKNHKIIHLGSLMLSEKSGRNLADRIVKEVKTQNKLLSFDINFREDIYKNKEEAIKIYQKYANQADIVKYSLEELKLFSNEEDIIIGLNKVAKKDQLIFLTLGKEGSIFYYNGKTISASSIEVKVVDTTGAGDAFFAGILTKLDSLDINSFKNDDSLIKEVLKFANIAGALTTTSKGAISAIPTLKEVNEYLNQL
jgi:fructokinase